MKKSSSRKPRGIVVSTEIIFILAVVIALAFLASLGIGRVVMNQAISTKANLLINNAQVWYFNATDTSSSKVFVTFHATNVGDKPVTITEVYVYIGGATYENTGVNKLVYPGETISLTLDLSLASGTPTFTNTGRLVVKYVDTDNRAGTVMQPVPLVNP